MIFVSSTALARAHGAYAIRRTPPATIKAQGTGVCAMVAQFPWGPDTILTDPGDTKTLLNMVAPRGMTRTGSGYLSLLGKGFPTLKFVRVVGATAAKATVDIPDAVPIITVEAKYKGSAGNSITIDIEAATDGDANHFNLKATVTGASGTTVDLFQNLNYSGTGADSTPTFTDKLLIGAITKLVAGRPANGTYTMSSGADGSVTAADYVGTPGAPDKGMSLLEADKTIRHVFVDDPGNTLRAAVNAGVKAHVGLMGDRIGYINGDSGLTKAQAITDVANYRSEFLVYVDNWPRIYDDTDGTLRLVPPAPFAASVAAQLSPSTSIAWKDSEVGDMLRAIVSTETPRGAGAPDLTDAGICTIIEEENGGFRFEAGVVTNAPVEPSRKTLTRMRMGIYIAGSFVNSVRSFIDAPNVEVNQDNVVGALDGFMLKLKNAQKLDPNHTPHVKNYEILDLAAENSEADIDAGDFTIPLNVKTSSGMERIFLSIQFGETVRVTAS